MFFMVKKILRKAKNKSENISLRRKISKALANENKKRKWRVELGLLLNVHSLEKGMSLENVRQGFGQEKANSVADNCLSYINAGGNKDSYAFREAMSVLKCYLEFSENAGTDVSKISEKYNLLNQRIDYIPTNAGCEKYNFEEIYSKIDTDYSKFLFSSRHSVRSYVNKPISTEIMNEVLELALSAPSACNRQPTKVFWTNNIQKVNEINKNIPGNKGFEEGIYNWAIVAVDREMFGTTESLQWYVNGGIFLSHFVMALHSYKIGSCIFQIPIASQQGRNLRKIADIPDIFAVVAVVGYGYPAPNVKRICADRKPVDEISAEF